MTLNSYSEHLPIYIPSSQLPENITSKLKKRETKLTATIDSFVSKLAENKSILLELSQKNENKFTIENEGVLKQYATILLRDLDPKEYKGIPNEHVIELISSRILAGILPKLQWQTLLQNLEETQKKLENDVRELNLNKVTPEKLTKDMKTALKATNKALIKFSTLENPPESTKVWKIQRQVKKNQSLHCRAERTSAAPLTLRDVKERVQVIKDSLSLMQKESGGHEEYQLSWMQTLGKWLAGAIKRPPHEQDGVDFVFTEKYHEQIADVHHQMEVLSDDFEKLGLKDSDSFSREFYQLKARIDEYHALMSFRIDYFIQDAAIEGAMMDLTDHTSEILSDKVQFSTDPLSHLLSELTELVRVSKKHQMNNPSPRLKKEIEQKLDYQTKLVIEKSAYFLKHCEDELQAEFEEDCAQITKHKDEESVYALSALYAKCDALTSCLQNNVNKNVLPAPLLLQLEEINDRLLKLENSIDSAVDQHNAQVLQIDQIDWQKLEVIHNRRTLLTKGKKRRDWQKKEWRKVDAESEPASRVQQIFSWNTAKLAAFFYLQQSTPILRSLGTLDAHHYEAKDQIAPANAPMSQPSEPVKEFQPVTTEAAFKAVLLVERDTLPAMTSQASSVSEPFLLTTAKAFGEILSEFISSEKAESLVQGTQEEKIFRILDDKIVDAQNRLAKIEEHSVLLKSKIETSMLLAKKNYEIERDYIDLNYKIELAKEISEIPISAKSSVTDVIGWLSRVQECAYGLDRIEQDVEEILRSEEMQQAMRLKFSSQEETLPATTLEWVQWLDEKKDITISQDLFRLLFPQDFQKTVIAEKKASSTDVWNSDKEFNPKILESLLRAFEEGRISSIVDRNGQEFTRIEYKNSLEKELHATCLDLEKTQIISKAFTKHFSHLKPSEKEVLSRHIVEYVDYIGIRQGNARKIFEKSKATKAIVQENSESWNHFLEDISVGMTEVVNKALQGSKKDDSILPSTIVITTTSSGGAHLSISRVIDEDLSRRDIPHVLVNESDLVEEDNLSKFTGIPRRDVFNKIGQQSAQMKYAKELKILDDKLSQFVPDQYMTEFRKSIGNSEFVVSTSHHGENVRVVAENAERICFQVCDYGEVSSKLARVAETVTKFNLEGISFFMPSERSTLQFTGEEESTVLDPSTSPKANDSLDEYRENYDKFAQVLRYPVHQEFRKKLSETELFQVKASLSEKYGFRMNAKTWAMSMGNQGSERLLKKYARQTIKGVIEDVKNGTSKGHLDVAVFCGNNKKLLEEMNTFCKDTMLKYCEGDQSLFEEVNTQLKFIPMPKLALEEVAAIGKISSAFLSKPGGGTSAEALIGNFPMIIREEKSHFWERGNVAELEMAGAKKINKKEGKTFYKLAWEATQARAPNPMEDEKDSVEYTIEMLWRLHHQIPGKSRV